MASELAMQLAAQAWCQSETSDKEMDVVLATAFANVLDNWLETAAQERENAAFYRDLIDQCAQVLGPEAYTAEDGTVMQDPVRLKVPELVAKLVRGACNG